MTATQLINADIDRVDAVNGPATGLPYLMFKNANGAPDQEAADKIAKSSEAADEVAEEVNEAETANIDGAPVDDLAAASAQPGDAAWEAVDASKARVAVSGLAVIDKLLDELAQREAAEGDDLENVFDLEDAKGAVQFALSVLARFSVTEQLEADAEADEAKAAAQALGLMKALHLEVHDGDKPADAPEAPAADAAPEAPVQDALTPEAPAAPAVKEAPLPSGLTEILDTFVEAYAAYKESQDSGAEDELTPEAADAAEQVAPAAPVADAQTPEAPAAPAPAPAAPAAPEHAAPAAPAAEHPAPAAPAAEEDKNKPVAKSMAEMIAEAVAEATAPLIKQIEIIGATPVNDGPLLAGQTPGGNAGMPLVRGQEEGAVAKGLTSAAAQAAPGTNPLAAALKGIHAQR